MTFSSVKLISITQPCIPECETPEELLAYTARVSNPTNKDNKQTAGKLLKYLYNHSHWSPFEMVDVTLEIITTRDIGRQILRHWTFSPQEFCLTGDSLITSVFPNSNKVYYHRIDKLYKRQTWRNYKNIMIRVYDEKNENFSKARIKEIFYTGVKPVFRFILEDGKQIKCTKEEKVYTENGFLPIENVVGLKLINNKAVMTKEGFIGVNGEPIYRNYEWLKKQRNIIPKKSLSEIANLANVTTHTIRKWLRIHNLQYSKKEVAEYTPVWNKGKFGYHTNLKHSENHLNSIRNARSGANSNWWKGGVDRTERQKIGDWCNYIRNRKLKEYNFSCHWCSSKEKLELDHIIPVYENIDLAYNYENIQVLCHKCHYLKHDKKERSEWRKKSKGNILVPKFKKIISVEFIGYEDTYDLEVEHHSHNFVANKIMVHNSQRYAEVSEEEFTRNIREARLQDDKNRQNSIETNDDLLDTVWKIKQKIVIDAALDCYKWALNKGIAKELARVVLPEGLTPTTIYLKGNLRTWVHYIQLREKNGTQKEHMEIAMKCKEIIIDQFPALKELI